MVVDDHPARYMRSPLEPPSARKLCAQVWWNRCGFNGSRPAATQRRFSRAVSAVPRPGSAFRWSLLADRYPGASRRLCRVRGLQRGKWWSARGVPVGRRAPPVPGEVLSAAVGASIARRRKRWLARECTGLALHGSSRGAGSQRPFGDVRCLQVHGATRQSGVRVAPAQQLAVKAQVSTCVRFNLSARGLRCATGARVSRACLVTVSVLPMKESPALSRSPDMAEAGPCVPHDPRWV